MEEYVGKIWDQWIAKTTMGRHPEAVVWLSEVEKSVGILFRSMGGDQSLVLTGVVDSSHQAKRHWMARLGGTQKKVPLSWLGDEELYLPEKIDLFPSPDLNRDLYLWLAALHAVKPTYHQEWLQASQYRVQAVLTNFPGLLSRYQRLLAAHLPTRPDPKSLSEDGVKQEWAICQALMEPGTVPSLPSSKKAPWPVPLWPHPNPDFFHAHPELRSEDAEPKQAENGKENPQIEQDSHKRRAERVETPEDNRGLILHRFESIFSWAEFIKVDRAMDEEEEPEKSKITADDMDVMSMARDNKPMAKRIRFDLDLPSEADDDLILPGEKLLPEWDYKKNRLIANYCRLIPMLSRDLQSCELPSHLSVTASKIRAEFLQLMPGRVWFRRQSDGSELDLEAVGEARADRLLKRGIAEPAIFQDFRPGERDMASLLLADLSLSTDAWVNNDQRIIDVIQEALFLFSEALSATSDPFALYGFSSRRRDHIRYHKIKGFSESYDSQIRGRIKAIKPGYYTRMGAAIRQSTDILASYPSGRRLLLILTDGKPNDLDKYEGRYGVEDTRMSILEAQKRGVRTFCVTIDDKAGEYAPYIFGADGFFCLKDVKNLPSQLPLLYAKITH